MIGRTSVVIPVLDDARLLAECLAALSRQTVPPAEVVVVDNGCTDDSADVARRFGARVVREDRPGITAASSLGFDEAHGEIIARCDADSVVPSTWIQRIEATLGAAPSAAAVTGPATFTGLSGIRHALAKVVYLSGYFVSMRALLGHNVLFGSNCAVRRAAWEPISPLVIRDDRDIHDDMDLSYRLPPTAIVIHDRELVVRISPRPFADVAVIVLRLRRAVRTFAIHLPRHLPHRRWAARLRTALVLNRDPDRRTPVQNLSAVARTLLGALFVLVVVVPFTATYLLVAVLLSGLHRVGGSRRRSPRRPEPPLTVVSGS